MKVEEQLEKIMQTIYYEMIEETGSVNAFGFDTRVFSHIAMHINGTKGKEQKFWCAVLDYKRALDNAV